MRRLSMASCPTHISVVLTRRQTALDADPARVQQSWKSFTRLKAYATLRSTLAEPLGARRRCAFCSDSRAADIEHFWPKSAYPERTYRFDNLLLVCPECNRAKLQKFPLDVAGMPLLVNPSADDPWDVLYFVPTTGIIDARIVSIDPSGAPVREPRGAATMKVLGPILNSGPVLEGRKQSWIALIDQLRLVLTGDTDLPATQAELFGHADLFGLGEFLMNREGKESSAVRELREASPERWQQLRDLPRS